MMNRFHFTLLAALIGLTLFFNACRQPEKPAPSASVPVPAPMPQSLPANTDSAQNAPIDWETADDSLFAAPPTIHKGPIPDKKPPVRWKDKYKLLEWQGLVKINGKNPKIDLFLPGPEVVMFSKNSDFVVVRDKPGGTFLILPAQPADLADIGEHPCNSQPGDCVPVLSMMDDVVNVYKKRFEGWKVLLDGKIVRTKDIVILKTNDPFYKPSNKLNKLHPDMQAQSPHHFAKPSTKPTLDQQKQLKEPEKVKNLKVIRQ